MIIFIIGLTVLTVFMGIICNIKTNAKWEGVDRITRQQCKRSEFYKGYYKKTIKNSKKTFIKYAGIITLIAIFNIALTALVWQNLFVIPCAFFYISILSFILNYSEEFENIIMTIMVMAFILALISLVATLIISGYATTGGILGIALLFIVLLLTLVNVFG